MMLGFSTSLRYFLCSRAVDMRNGFDGLAGLVRNHLKQEPLSGDVFIFINNRGTHLKMLYWDGDGFALFYKRLERGRFVHTIVKGLSAQLSKQELMMLLEGLSFKEIRKAKTLRSRVKSVDNFA
jgi:transposase